MVGPIRDSASDKESWPLYDDGERDVLLPDSLTGSLDNSEGSQRIRNGKYGTTSLCSGQSVRSASKILYHKSGRRKQLTFSDTIEKISLAWHGIEVYAPVEGKTCCSGQEGSVYKNILKNVSGVAMPGTLLAILGASGSGKTTLLNVLTCRNRGHLVVNGDVRVNGQRVGEGMTSLSGYVQQDDLFIETLTAREHLWFQAMLRMDADLPKAYRKERIIKVLAELGLTKCADSYIGKPGFRTGISGGERKRLSFASEILTNPPLLFCDEPTSGLDSFMAENVIQTLKSMADRGKTVICTIHQPSSQTYTLFDRVMLMAEGRVAYLGPACDCIDFFSSIGFTCPLNFNPADYFVHTLAIIPGMEAECRKTVQKICSTYEASLYKEDVISCIEANVITDECDIFFQDAEAYSDRSRYKAGVIRQFMAVFWRSWASCYRNTEVFLARVLQQLVLTIIVGICYSHVNYDVPGGVMSINGALFFVINELSWSNEGAVMDLLAVLGGLLYLQQQLTDDGVQSINGAIFWALSNITMCDLYQLLRVFPQETPLFFRDYGNGMYRPSIYYFCKTLAEIPIYVFYPALFISIFYWMVGLYPGYIEFFVAVGTVILVANCAVSFGYMLSCFTSNVSIVYTLAPPLTIPLMLFGGFFINIGSIPVWLEWLKYFSWFGFANEILVVNQWQKVENISCTLEFWNDTSSLPPGCYNTGTDVIRQMRFSSDNMAFDFAMLFAMFVGYRLIGLLALLIRIRRKQ